MADVRRLPDIKRAEPRTAEHVFMARGEDGGDHNGCQLDHEQPDCAEGLDKRTHQESDSVGDRGRRIRLAGSDGGFVAAADAPDYGRVRQFAGGDEQQQRRRARQLHHGQRGGARDTGGSGGGVAAAERNCAVVGDTDGTGVHPVFAV